MLVVLLICLCAAWVPIFAATTQLTVAQISDIHIGVKEAPDAASKLAQAVSAINARHPDLVVVTGDIGENPGAWQQAKSILGQLKAPVKYLPGNHDVHTSDVDRYRAAFGSDYYTFNMKGVAFVVFDSQLLTNADNFRATSVQALPVFTQDESRKMLQQLGAQVPTLAGEKIVIGLQHIPVDRNGNFPPDSKPYWVISEPYRSQELALLKQMRIHHMLVGHWHEGMVFDADGITWHVGPATSWLPWGGQLGFAMHTIGTDGSVTTEFFDLKGKSVGGTAPGPSTPATPPGPCPAPQSRAVSICAPSDGAQVASPVHVSAATTGSGAVTVIQIYVDGKKTFEQPGAMLEKDLTLPAGTHKLTVQGMDGAGFFKTSVTVKVQ
jgi:3',5'-cyclic AMP phosphodiesterase CpdA